MDAIQTARELGKVIQADERYRQFFAAKEANDNDEDLQQLIGEFNLQRENLTREASKGDNKEQSKIDSLNTAMRATYEQIMSNVNMRRYTAAKTEVDAFISRVNQIIAMCCEGADPDTCEPAGGCGSGCSSCAGCK